MRNRKNKPWAPPWLPSKRKRFNGVKREAISPEMKQHLRELDDTVSRLNAWASGEPQEVEERTIDSLTSFWEDAIKYGVAYMKMPTNPKYLFKFGGREMNFDTYNNVEKQRTPDPFPWHDFIKTIPDLKGQIIGAHTIVWGHKISFKKFTNPIVSRYGDILSEGAGMLARCECGWLDKDILPKVIEKTIPVPDTNRIYELTKPRVDLQLLEKVIMEHIQGTYEEMEYITIPLEFLEDLPGGFLKTLLSLLKTSGAIMHFEFDTRTYLIIDDAMDDAAIAELTEMLAGYEVGTRKVRVLRP